MVGPVLIYRSGQTYPLPAAPTTNDISSAEVGAIFSFPSLVEPDRTLYRIVIIQDGTVNHKIAIVYHPVLANAIDISAPPTRSDIDANPVDSIFDYVSSENKKYYYQIVEVEDKKYVAPYQVELAAFRLYVANEEFPVAAWPHTQLTEIGAILVWGDQKYIAVRRGNRILYEDYKEEVSWPLNTIWKPPIQTSAEITVDWSQIEVWSSSNSRAWRQIPTGGYVSDETYLNFAGYIGWSLTFLFNHSQKFITSNSIPVILDNGIRLVARDGTLNLFSFSFNSPINIKSFKLIIESTARAGEFGRYSSGPFVIENKRNPRYPKPRWRSTDLFGFGTIETINFDGWVAGPLNSPFPAAEIRLDGLADGFTIRVDNSDFPADSIITITDWKIEYLDVGGYYQIDYDFDQRSYVGRALNGGPSVALSAQNLEDGWFQTNDSVSGMDIVPDHLTGRTKGFFSFESFWSTNQNVMLRCQKDDAFDADWFLQKTAGICHPFDEFVLQTYRRNTAGSRDLTDRRFSGLFLYRNETEVVRFFDKNTSISADNDNAATEGYPVPNLTLNIDRLTGKPDIELTVGSYTSALFTTLFNQGAPFSDYVNKPGGDVLIQAGDAFWGAKGGDINLVAGASLGQNQAGGNLRLVLAEPLDMSRYGFAIRPTTPQDQKGDRGFVEFVFTENRLEHVVSWPNTHPPKVGMTLQVARLNDETLGGTTIRRRALLDWAEAGGSGLVSVPASGALNPDGTLPDHLTDRPDVQGLINFNDKTPRKYLIERNGEWILANFVQFGTSVADLFTTDRESFTEPTIVWDEAVNKAYVIEPPGNRYPLSEEEITRGDTLPNAQTPGDLYLYEDPNPVESDRHSRPYAKLHGAWYALPVARDLSEGGEIEIEEGDTLPDPAAIAESVKMYLYSDPNEQQSRPYVRLNDAFYAVPMSRDLGELGGVSSGTTLPTQDTEGFIYAYVDENPVIADRQSRLYAKLNDDSWFAVPMSRDLGGGGETEIAEGTTIPDPDVLPPSTKIYLHSDPNQVESRPYARLNDAFYALLMPSDLNGGAQSGGVTLPVVTELPGADTPGNICIYDAPNGRDSAVYVKFAQGWSAMLMPKDFA